MLWESIISSVKYLFIASIIALSCAPPKPKPVVVPSPELPAPYDLKATADSHKATLFWSIERTANIPISGYNIYISDFYVVRDTAAWEANPGTPYNNAPYPGDTDGDIRHESIPLNHLDNGRTYLALVRTVGLGGRESGSSNITFFTPLAKGEFIISSDHEAPNGGFNFETETQVPGRDPRSDIYLYATPDKIGLSAPYRLGGGFRKTKFWSPAVYAQVETIPITKGQIIGVLTKTGQADIRIEDIMGRYPDISARVSYTFSPDKPQ